MLTSSDYAILTSTMRDVKLDRDNPLDLHEQVAGRDRRAIADGEAKAGERLPPARDLAAVLGVNTNTVLRALRQLRDEVSRIPPRSRHHGHRHPRAQRPYRTGQRPPPRRTHPRLQARRADSTDPRTRMSVYAQRCASSAAALAAACLPGRRRRPRAAANTRCAWALPATHYCGRAKSR